MELRQRVSAGGILMEQTAREYTPTDYEDVGEEFICEWLVRRFAGLNVASGTREMLYHHIIRQIGPAGKYRYNKQAANAMGVTLGTFKTGMCRLLKAAR